MMTNVMSLQCFNLLVLGVDVQCNNEINEHPLKLSAKNTQSNGWPYKSLFFCRVQWALNSGSKVLIHSFPFVQFCKSSTGTVDI